MKTEYDADAAFLYPYTGRTGTPLFMPSCYAVGAKRALLYGTGCMWRAYMWPCGQPWRGVPRRDMKIQNRQ